MRSKDRQGFHGEYSCEIDGERLVQAFRKAALDGLRAFMEGLEAGLGEDSQPEPRAPRRKAAKPKAAKAKPAKAKAAKARRGAGPAA